MEDYGTFERVPTISSTTFKSRLNRMSWKIWRRNGSDFLTLRDDYQYILKHIGDFQNADGTPANHDQLVKDFEEVVTEINSMEKQASACVRDASKCAFTIFDASRFVLPTLTPKATDPQVARGTILANQDPLAAALAAMHSRTGPRVAVS